MKNFPFGVDKRNKEAYSKKESERMPTEVKDVDDYPSSSAGNPRERMALCAASAASFVFEDRP